MGRHRRTAHRGNFRKIPPAGRGCDQSHSARRGAALRNQGPSGHVRERRPAGCGQGHPRSSGTFARVLGVYVREQKIIPLMEALRRMSLMPAQRLEASVPGMRNKGRIKVGADADLVAFDPDRVIDRATFENAAQYSEGIENVMVAGVFVLRDGKFVPGVFPGVGLRTK